VIGGFFIPSIWTLKEPAIVQIRKTCPRVKITTDSMRPRDDNSFIVSLFDLTATLTFVCLSGRFFVSGLLPPHQPPPSWPPRLCQFGARLFQLNLKPRPVGMQLSMVINIHAFLLRSYDRFGRMIASSRSITLGRTVARSRSPRSRSRSAAALAAISALSARCAAF
jgi:hypothetical protein